MEFSELYLECLIVIDFTKSTVCNLFFLQSERKEIPQGMLQTVKYFMQSTSLGER